MFNKHVLVIFYFFSVFLVSFHTQASDKKQTLTRLQGQWLQGALVQAQVAPGTQVEAMGRQVFVDKRGRFIVGLGRDLERVAFSLTHPQHGKANLAFDVKAREYKIQRIDGVANKYVNPPEAVLERIRNDVAQVKEARKHMREARDFEQGFIWPAKGRLTGVYGSQRVFNGVPKRPHYGLDIAGPVGAPVRAPAPGVVTLAHPDMYYSGGTLIIDHGQGLSSTFIHLHKLLVGLGQEVKQGELIAEIGATGRVTGPHLDWRVNWFEQRLDPALLLPPKPGKTAD